MSMISSALGAAGGGLFVVRWLALIVYCPASPRWRPSGRRCREDHHPVLAPALGAVAGGLFVVRWLAFIMVGAVSPGWQRLRRRDSQG
jgi:hypothetical protein